MNGTFYKNKYFIFLLIIAILLIIFFSACKNTEINKEGKTENTNLYVSEPTEENSEAKTDNIIEDTNKKSNNSKSEDKMTDENLETAVMGGGCFWCLEAVFDQLKGVVSADSGYAGGYVKNPTYQQVCSGKTGHAEVVKITFNPKVISYRDLQKIFFYIHDPTTLNRQGNDIGEQYRSIILFNSSQQEKIAKELIAELTDQKFFKNPIVTEIKPLEVFYKAEDYHQQYYENNTAQPYCQIIILPKLEKFKDKFGHLLK